MPVKMELKSRTNGVNKMKWFLIGAYAACIPLANWMIANIGSCVPNGPCVIDIAPGYSAPSGVLIIGISLVLRDAVQMVFGWKWGLGSILIGALVSYALAPPYIVIASVAAFVLSELIDFLVYTPLARRRLVAALILSGIVGAVVDSAIFLNIAFGSLNFVEGQIIGKIYGVIAASVAILIIRKVYFSRSGVV